MRVPGREVGRVLAGDGKSDLSVNEMEREMGDTHGSEVGYI